MKKIVMDKDVQGKVEVFSCAVWAFLDMSWMMEMNTICYILILPLVLSMLSLAVTVEEKNLKILNSAWLSWTVMNVLWMTNDFIPNASFMVGAKVAGITGVILLGIALKNAPGRQKLFQHLISLRQRLNSFFV